MQWKSMHCFSGQEALEVVMSGVVDMDIKLILYVADGDTDDCELTTKAFLNVGEIRRLVNNSDPQGWRVG